RWLLVYRVRWPVADAENGAHSSISTSRDIDSSDSQLSSRYWKRGNIPGKLLSIGGKFFSEEQRLKAESSIGREFDKMFTDVEAAASSLPLNGERFASLYNFASF